MTDALGRRFELRPHSCPTCGPSAAKVLGLRGGRHHRGGLGVEVTIKRCRSCGAIYPDPFPHPLDPQELYGDPDKYFAGHDVDRKVNNGRRLVRQLREMVSTGTPSLLDVGSGRGEVLAGARLEGLDDVVGLELSHAMIDDARKRFGVEVLAETVEQHAASAGRRYDIVVLASVLEHVVDPDATVAAIAALTEPGAVLYLELPAEPSLFSAVANVANRVRGRRTVVNLSPTFPPYHVHGFDPRSARRLLAKHGFVVERHRVWADPHLDAGNGLLSAAVTTLNRFANVIGRSSNMELWARRVSSPAASR